MTFYSFNRFIVTPSEGIHQYIKSFDRSFEASAFFTKAIPRNAIYFLNFLELVIPPFDEDYLSPDSTAYDEWLQTVTYIKEYLNLPTLTLRIDFADCRDTANCYLPKPRPFHSGMLDQRSKLVRIYARVIAPLEELKGLKRFFVHIQWPFHWTEDGRLVRYSDPASQQRGVEMLEKGLEQRVKGPAYDSKSLGKDEVRNSQWREEDLNRSEYD